MKKLLLAISTAAVATVATANVNIEYQWAKAIDGGTSVMSMVNSIANAPDGDYYITTGVAKTTSLAWGETDITPEGGISTAYQRDWTIARMDAEGNLKWSVTANDANVAQTYQYLAETPDGGVVMMANATFNSAAGAGAPTLMTFTDTTGKLTTITLQGTPEGKAPYVGVILKFNADGAYEWNRVISATEYESDGAFDANVVALRGIAVDNDGNIYVGGSYKTALVLGEGNQSRYAINLGVEYNGKTYNNGDAFIARFNSLGENTGLLTSTSDTPYASSETVSALTINGNTLYCALLSQAGTNLRYNLFDNEVELAADQAANVVYGKIDLDSFTCTGANSLIAGATDITKSHTAQIQNIQLLGDRLYISGSNNGALIQNGNTIIASSSAKLENITVAVDPQTMEVTTAYVTNSNNIGNTFGAILDESTGKLYTIAYQFTGGLADLYEFNAADGALESTTTFAVGAGTMARPLFNNETKQLLAATYSKQLTNLGGTDESTPAYTAFHGILMSFKLPGVTSGIGNISYDTTANDAPVEYFSLQGIRIAAPAPGTIAIRRQGNVVTKVVVK